MQDQFQWVDTTGGPHVIAAVESLAKWRGIEGWIDNGLEDPSDYARACRVRNWLGKVSSGTGCEAVVLSGDRGPVAWFPDPVGDAGVLVQWIGCDSEEAAFALLRSWQATPAGERPYAEIIEFDTGISGAMRLFDSTEVAGGSGATGLTITLQPGRHKMLAVLVEAENCVAVLREIRRA